MRWIMLIAIVAGGAGTVSAQAQPSNVALEELHRLVDDHQYGPALQKITAGLALKGAAAKLVNRYELFMLKGECHLKTKATRLALEAYAAAIKEAPSDRERELATAQEMLLKSSKAFAYTPRTTTAPAPPAGADKPRPVPIDILNPDSRKKAFAALLADELAANDAKFKSAKASK